MKKFLIYADTSVFGGCFDDEFSEESKSLFENIKSGKFILIISATTLREINNAPDYVQRILAELPPEMMEVNLFIFILQKRWLNNEKAQKI